MSKNLITIKIGNDVTINAKSTDEAIAAAIEAYRTLETPKAKAAARTSANSAMAAAIDATDIETAMWAKKIGGLMVSAKAAAEPTDPKEVLIDAVAELELAAWLIRSGLEVPAGLELPDGFDFESVEYVADAFNVKVLDDAVGEARAASILGGAKAFASAKRTRATDRIDIGAAILKAFDGLEDGAFLTVSEIAKKSGAGTGPIMARLFPVYRDKKTGTVESRECTVEGITPGTGGKNDVKGAYKG